MSTLRVDNLLNSAGNESPISVPGTAKAWIVFDGTSSSIGTGAASYNVSGVTDHGTGDFEIAFATAMSSTNYGHIILGNHPTSGNQGFAFGYQSHVNNVLGGSRATTTSLRFFTGWLAYQSGPNQSDLNPTTVVIYGA